MIFQSIDISKVSISTLTGDLYAVARGIHAKDASINVVIYSSISKSFLLHSSSSSDFALQTIENKKFSKDLRNPEPLQHSATQRFIPLALNQCGLRGPHFEAMLRDHA